MIINRHALLRAAPIKDMLTEKVRGEITSHGLSEAGYDIRIKQNVSFERGQSQNVAFDSGQSQNVAFERGQSVWANWFSSNTSFALASTIEEFDMPFDMVGVVHDKSTWARKGLSVFNTVIEPGWKGFLTLELVYHGRETLYIPAGSGIAQVLFHSTAITASYEGKYQDQADQPVEAIHG
jgi:dCTP deaminase